MVDVRLFGDVDVQAELDALRKAPVNYELDGPPTRAKGWTFDHYCLRLPAERPGGPEPDGAFQVACRLVRDYEFADPSIIKGVWRSDTPLPDRTMLLEGRFLALRFLLGVRVSEVIDEVDETDGRRLQTWGWCYRTLSGHLEAGQMCYRVVKDLDSGQVEFRISRYVRPEQIPNPVVRLGWHVFGRAMQVLFVKRSMARMKRLVDAELLPGRHTAGVPLLADELEVHEDR